jgi:hypothetical protein
MRTAAGSSPASAEPAQVEAGAELQAVAEARPEGLVVVPKGAALRAVAGARPEGLVVVPKGVELRAVAEARLEELAAQPSGEARLEAPPP